MREIREAATPVFGSYFGSICNSEPTARFPPETGEQPRRRRRRRRGDDEGFKYPLTNVPVACFVLGFLDETGEQPPAGRGQVRRNPRTTIDPSGPFFQPEPPAAHRAHEGRSAGGPFRAQDALGSDSGGGSSS